MQKPPRYRRVMSRRRLLAGAAGSVAAVGLGAVPTMCRGKIYPGVNMLGVDVSGMTPDDGEAALREQLLGFESHALTFVLGERSWDAALSDLGLAVDYQSMLKTAMTSVREQGLPHRYAAVLLRDGVYEVPLYLREDRARLDRFIKGIAAEVEIKPSEARLYTSGSSVEILQERVGRTLDVEDAKIQALQAVRSGRTETIQLRTDDVVPSVTAADLEGVKEQASKLVSEPETLTRGEKAYVLGADELSSALMIGADNVPALETERLRERIDQIALDVTVHPKNVMLGWNDGLFVVEPDIDGVEMDRVAIRTVLNDVARSDDRVAELPLTVRKAPARVDNMNSLGLEHHLASGSSSFAGSSYDRAANVAVSAANVSYKLVAPGEAFSFNDLLGPITIEQGYIAGSIIQGDFAATDIGGGVCQVSTTVFRAAQNAGFRFTEWNPHSWRLAFYEADGSSPGLDAAIYQANNEWEYELDLKFVNPLDSWLMLQVIIDGDWATAHFYGRDPGWNIEIFPARISDPKPIPAPVEKENASLSPGERRMVQASSPGYTVWVRRKVTDANGIVISDGDFVSDYVSQPEAWEVGPS